MVLERQSGILSKVVPCLVGVVHDLGGEGLEGGELPLLPQVLVKLHLDLLAVEVAVEIQDEALDGQLVAVVDGGAPWNPVTITIFLESSSCLIRLVSTRLNLAFP